MADRRPLARLRKRLTGKRGISQHQAHIANLHREFREDSDKYERPQQAAYDPSGHSEGSGEG